MSCVLFVCGHRKKTSRLWANSFFSSFSGKLLVMLVNIVFVFWGGKISYLGNYNDRGLVLVMRNNEAIISI